ncbi:unnamed protein product, partial [Mycena citricolor]
AVSQARRGPTLYPRIKKLRNSQSEGEFETNKLLRDFPQLGRDSLGSSHAAKACRLPLSNRPDTRPVYLLGAGRTPPPQSSQSPPGSTSNGTSLDW